MPAGSSAWFPILRALLPSQLRRLCAKLDRSRNNRQPLVGGRLVVAYSSKFGNLNRSRSNRESQPTRREDISSLLESVQRHPGIRGYAIARTPGNRRDDRTKLPPGKPVCCRFAGRGIRSAQRGAAQPGAGFVRHCGTNSAHYRGNSAGGRLLVRRNHMERPACDADQREQLVNDRRRCREEHRGDPASCAEKRPDRPAVASRSYTRSKSGDPLSLT